MRDTAKIVAAMCARVPHPGDGAICSKNRKIVPYHRDNLKTRNGVCLRSLSPIIAPDQDTSHRMDTVLAHDETASKSWASTCSELLLLIQHSFALPD